MSSDTVAQDQLQAFVRRIESLEDEIGALNSDKSEVYREAKGNGFDVKVLRKLIADRRKDATERMEFDALYELYAAALGMIEVPYDEPEEVVRAHVENIEEFPPVASGQHVAANTEVGLAEPAVSRDGEPANTKSAHDAGSSNGRTAEFDSANAGSTPAPASNLTTFTPKPLRPYCLNADKCGGQGRKHCWSCQKAHDEKQGVA